MPNQPIVDATQHCLSQTPTHKRCSPTLDPAVNRAKFGVRPEVFADGLIYSIRPATGSVSLTPLGATLDLSVMSPQYTSATILKTTLGFNTAVGAFGFLRYETDALSISPSFTTRFSVQGGIWPFDPHLAGVRTKAFGVKSVLNQQLLKEPVLLVSTTELGLVQLISGSSLLLDARGELVATRQDSDAWGYKTSGWRSALTGLWSATNNGPSLGLWMDGGYTLPLAAGWRLDSAVRVGYRPAWPIPISTSATLAGLGSIGMSRSFGLPLVIFDNRAELNRATFEPRLRFWLDDTIHYGLDSTLSLDTTLLDANRVTFAATIGYAQHFWYRLGVRVTP